MLNCKQVAQLASDYLDQEPSTKLTWQMRIHLAMCANCRRFVRHLRIAKTIASQIKTEAVDAEEILVKIKAKQQLPTDDSH
jgi:predicted anti-sigma-YlaC factor YlaD